MVLVQQYQANVNNKDIVYDAAQEQAVNGLQLVFDALIARENSIFSSVVKKIKMALGLKIEPVCGVYLWGGVGRGKTYLMDLFFKSLPGNKKKRLHFHHFMRLVHAELKNIQGKNNPLKHVATRFSAHFSVLCFDEFYVNDIADAMLMASLFHYLFEQGVTLVATSNIHPENLYHNGLQRTSFLPTIALIKKYTKIMELKEGCDYRLQFLEGAHIFQFPLDEEANSTLYHYFEHLASHNVLKNQKINILGRDIPTILMSSNVIWLDFSSICQGPRSQYDYVEISMLFHTVIISNVKRLDDFENDTVKRFIMMVDEFYERHVTLIMSLECAVEDLYQGKILSFEFERTLSRLQEMRSKKYLALQHLS